VGVLIVDLPTFQEVDAKSWVRRYDVDKPHGYIHPKVIEMHTKNGLWHDCFCSPHDDLQKLDTLISQYVVDSGCQGAQLAGANPDFDRRFLEACLPQTAKTFHYRNFDTNAFWLLKSYITGDDAKLGKPATHRALDDCRDAVKVVEDFFEFVTELCRPPS
jgi:oligoribonuclease (3'-5' exoribonuclease)